MSKALNTFTEDLLTQVGNALSELLAHPIALKQGKISAFEESSLAPFGDDFIASLTAAVTEPHEGTVYVAFDLPRVVVLGALLEMVPAEGIGERLADPKFDEDNADAFEEVGNILIGKLDEAIRDDLGAAKIHTKKGETVSGTPAEVFAQIHANGDYYCLDTTIEIEGQESGPVCFLLHPSLVEAGFKADPEITKWRIGGAASQDGEAETGDRPIGGSDAAGDETTGGGVSATAGDGKIEAAADTEGDEGEGGKTTAAVAPGDDEAPSSNSTADDPPLGESGAGNGASATPGVPTPVATARRPRPSSSGGGGGAPLSIDGRPVLLVVDDDITTRSILRTWLDGGDFLVYEAVSWREASLFLRRHRIDAVILDLYLHDLNGIEACRRLHLHPATRDVPVILCASHPSREAIVQGLKAGAMDFLVKPFDRQRLMEKLEVAAVAVV